VFSALPKGTLLFPYLTVQRQPSAKKKGVPAYAGTPRFTF
jgi:hypothetical protein